MKPFKIPFTNILLSSEEKKVSGKGYISARGNGLFAERDMSGFKLSYESLFNAYRNQSDIFACIREWRENVGCGGYKWQVPDKPDDTVPPQDVAQLNATFNYLMPWRQLKSRTVRDLGVTGNAYWAIIKAMDDKTILGFQPLDPRTISIVSDKSGKVLKYIQRVGQGQVDFEAHEIIHFMVDSDPNNEVFGMSPMEPIIWEARTDLSAMMTNYYFFENMGVPAVNYILDENLSEEAYNEAIQTIKENMKGVKNYNKSSAMKGVKEIKVLSVSQKDMEFLQGRRFTTEKICSAYGVPKFLLGYTDTVNNNNGTELLKKFYKGTIEPLEEMIAEVINRDFIGRTELAGKVMWVFNPQVIDEQASIEERAQKEVNMGLLSPRQYKKKTGQDITPEDEKNPNFDAYIIYQGASATLLEDVGVDPMIDQENTQVAQNLIEELKKSNARTVLRK